MKINVLEKVENDEQLITSMYHQISNVITENKTKMIYYLHRIKLSCNVLFCTREDSKH